MTSQLAGEAAAGHFLLWLMVYALASVTVLGFACFCIGWVRKLCLGDAPQNLPSEWERS